jgi:catechol 2,3-dioxygenase-like lactoylglutathione lyase family enzyme
VQIQRTVIVFDAADIETESSFWAGLLGGEVYRDDNWHSIVVDGDWVMGVQFAPAHIPPDWPKGTPGQQMHLDLHVDDLGAAHKLVISLGGRQLQGPRKPADNPDGAEMFAVYADPAGHPFCIGVH